MLTLFQHSFCPHSRFVRLVLEEYGLEVRCIEEKTWERREDFLVMNPAGTTPVLVEEGYPAVPGPGIIAEFLDETRGAEFGEQRLLPGDSLVDQVRRADGPVIAGCVGAVGVEPGRRLRAELVDRDDIAHAVPTY